jgi:hypothetical protein
MASYTDPDHLTAKGWYGDIDSPRQVEETLIRSLALQIAAAIAFGHLLSLRKVSSRWWPVSVLSIITHAFFPTLSVAQLIRNSLSAFKVLHTKGVFRHLDSYVSASLGMHAMKASQPGHSQPMLCFDIAVLRRTRRRYDAWFLGRVLVLRVLLTQLTGTVFLWVRRARVYGGPYRLWAIDNRNLEVACGAISVVFLSISIQCLNSTWEVLDDASTRSPESTSQQQDPEIGEVVLPNAVPTSHSPN